MATGRTQDGVPRGQRDSRYRRRVSAAVANTSAARSIQAGLDNAGRVVSPTPIVMFPCVVPDIPSRAPPDAPMNAISYATSKKLSTLQFPEPRSVNLVCPGLGL